jgi:myosin heavy subunit
LTTIVSCVPHFILCITGNAVRSINR